MSATHTIIAPIPAITARYCSTAMTRSLYRSMTAATAVSAAARSAFTGVGAGRARRSAATYAIPEVAMIPVDARQNPANQPVRGRRRRTQV